MLWNRPEVHQKNNPILPAGAASCEVRFLRGDLALNNWKHCGNSYERVWSMEASFYFVGLRDIVLMERAPSSF